MAEDPRAQRTLDKMRRGGLPAPTKHTQRIGAGDGAPCDGCGQPIRATDACVRISIHRALDWTFHEGCYEAWATFREGPARSTDEA
jgi:hypothetical protein